MDVRKHKYTKSEIHIIDIYHTRRSEYITNVDLLVTDLDLSLMTQISDGSRLNSSLMIVHPWQVRSRTITDDCISVIDQIQTINNVSSVIGLDSNGSGFDPSLVIVH